MTRPLFHFTADGWINDPHAITVERGRYHRFFQYVPEADAWALGCAWGHAVGGDLITATLRPIALAPGDGDDGVWSGGLVRDAEGRARILYTSVTAENPQRGRVRVAEPVDDTWDTWVKGEVVAETPEGVTGFRDPAVVVGDAGWTMIVGAALEGGTDGGDGVGAVLGYTSPDGRDWTPTGVVAERASTRDDAVFTGTLWECPQLVAVEGRHVLIVSVWADDVIHDVAYSVGSFADGRFAAGPWRRLTLGDAPYAATTFRDAAGRACVQFWLRGFSGEGWTGAHSLPYVLSLRGDAVVLAPHPDLDAYRDDAPRPGGAVDLDWPREVGGGIRIRDDSGTVARLEKDGGMLVVTVGSDAHRHPWAGRIRAVVDGPILAVSSDAGLFAVPIPSPRGTWHVDGAAVAVRGLRHPGQG